VLFFFFVRIFVGYFSSIKFSLTGVYGRREKRSREAREDRGQGEGRDAIKIVPGTVARYILLVV
jgi:hypothetical protein